MKLITKNPLFSFEKAVYLFDRSRNQKPNVVLCSPESYLDLVECASYLDMHLNEKGEKVVRGIKIEVDKNTIGFRAILRKAQEKCLE